MRPNVIAGKIRMKAAKNLLISLALLFIGAYSIYQVIRYENVDVSTLTFPAILFKDDVTTYIAGVALLVCIILFCMNILRAINPERSGIARRLPGTVSLRDIDEQYQAVSPEDFHRIRGSLYYRNRFYIAKDWLIVETFWNFRIYSAGSILWAYLKIEGVRMPPTAIISTSKTNLVLRTTAGNLTVAGEEDSVYGFLHSIQKAYPWVVTDYTRALETLWQDDRETFINRVNEKKKEAGQ